MDHPNHPKHYNSKGGGSTDRQNVHISQSGLLPVAQKGAHTRAGPDGAFVTGENPEIIAIERQMGHMFLPRGPPTGKPTGSRTRPNPPSSSTQPQTLQHSGVQAQQPAAFAQGPLVATATGNRPPQPWIQTNQNTSGQTHQLPHGHMHKVPHGQAHQVPHAQMHQVPHAQAHQVPHAQMHQVPHAQQAHQVPHAQMHQVPHAQTHQVPHAQMHQVPHAQTHQVPHAQTYQPTQVQMPRANEGGTSSHDRQRGADRRRTNDNDRIPAVTANQRTTAGSRR